MSNETARLARQLAEGANPDNLTDTAKAARERILATTTPLTMADTVWDDEEHHLAGATTPSGIEVVMLWLNTGINRIVTDDALYARDMLTPNGKRYELREVGAPEQPAHPETLETQADYENAPEGTIVAYAGCSPYLKKGPDKWEDTHYEVRGNEGMSGVSRQMLRRGWGE